MATNENKRTESAGQDLFVSNPLVTGFLHYAASRDLELARVLSPMGHTFESFQDVDGRTPERLYDLIFEGVEKLSQDAHLGLQFGRMFNLQHIGVLGYLMMNCETFEQSLDSYERFQNGLGETIAIRHAILGSEVKFEIQMFGGERSGRQRLEAFLSSFIVSGVQLTGRPLKISKCITPYGPVGDIKIYESILGTVPGKGTGTSFFIEKSYLSHLVINSVPELFSMFEKNLISHELNQNKNPVSQKVRKELLKRIGKDQMENLSTIATILGMSDRTLQMKLEQEGVKFREILESCQLDFAGKFLLSGSPIAEISYALGFSEPSAFQRAFKRWTGQTPAQYRAFLNKNLNS